MIGQNTVGENLSEYQMSFTRSCWRVYVFHNYHGFMSAVVYQSLYMYNVVYFRTEFCWDRYRIPGIWVCVWYSGTRRYTGIEINQVSCRNHSEWGIMTSLILCVLRSGEVASLDNTHKSNDVIMTSRSYHVTITLSIFEWRGPLQTHLWRLAVSDIIITSERWTFPW